MRTLGRCRITLWVGLGVRLARLARLACLAGLAGLENPAIAAGPAAPPPPPRLVAGAGEEAALAAGESRSFRAELAADRAYLVAVEERGIDVAVALRAPGGEGSPPAVEVDGSADRFGVELALLHPAGSGSYTVEVRAVEKGVGPGRFGIRVEELSEGTPAERERAAALAAATRAGTILVGRQPGSLELARAAFEEARGHFRAAGDRPGEAAATVGLAAVSQRLGKKREAADLFREAAGLFRALDLPAREARAWTALGLTLWQQSDLPAADEALARGLALAREHGFAYQAADLENDRCLVLHARGEVRPALDCYRAALALFRALGEPRDEAAVLNNLGFAFYNLGEPQAAEESYRQALALRRSAEDREGEVETLNNLAVLSRSLGEIGDALADYGEAKALLATLDDRGREAAALHNLGAAYAALGETERARVYLSQALDLRRAVEDRRGEITTLNLLGWLALQGGDPEPAITFYRQALELARSTADPRAEAIVLGYLGEALAARGSLAEALDSFDRALALARRVGDRYNEAVAERRKAAALVAAGREAEALPLLEPPLAFSRAVGDRVGEAAALSVRARAHLATGRLDEARADAEAAGAAVEAVRTRLGTPELRASFAGARGDAAEIRVDALMRLDAARPGQGFARAALEASEQHRALSLLDVLYQSRSSIHSLDPALAGRRRDLELRLALKVDRRQGLLGRAKPDLPAARALEREIAEIEAELDREDSRLRRHDPRYAALTRPQAASLPEIQALLDPGTLLLEYSLGTARSYLWVVGPDSLAAHVLPGRGEIERAARAFHEALSAPPSPTAGGPAGTAEWSAAGEALGRMLLAPIAAELRDDRLVRLAVVADGALGYVPFDVLPDAFPEPRKGAAPPTPLLARREVVLLPSASVLAAERRDLAARPPAPHLALVLADPVFERADPRLAPAAGAPAPAAPAHQGGETGDVPRFSRLRFSGPESQGIAALAPPGAVAVESGFAANRELVLSGRLHEYRYLHFATHGVFDAARPELSGLVLSRLGADGAPREGFLGLRDVYGLDLDADLVVLSGCQTALGRQIRGEGLLGLTRGFLYAGARRVVASLWWVDDRATAELMTRFYRGLWSEGLRPAAALRQARLELAGERRYRAPFYWGSFVLQGDWR